MKLEIEEIINELIKFDKTRKPKEFLNNALKKNSERDVYVLTSKILLWHKKVFLNLESPDKYDLSANEKLQERFGKFFKDCPALNNVFSFHQSYIGWSDNISEEEQKEIRDYIHENHKVQVRIRRNKPL